MIAEILKGRLTGGTGSSWDWVKRIGLWLALVAFIIGGAVGLFSGLLFSSPRPGLEPVDLDGFEFKRLRSPGADAYNVILAPAAWNGDSTARLMLGSGLARASRLDDLLDYYYVDFRPEQVVIGRVEQNLKLPLLDRAVQWNGDRVTVKRRQSELSVWAGSRLLARVFDDSLPGQGVVYGYRGGTDPFGQARARIQPIREVGMASDFMKAPEEASRWQPISGEWKIAQLSSPSMSTNAFYYIGRPDEGSARTVAGHGFWDNYAFTVSLRVPKASKKEGHVGLLFYYRDEQNFHLFRWGEGEAGARSLIKVRRGKPTLLASSRGGYRLGQWYRLKVQVIGPAARGFIDGNVVLQCRDDDLSSGKIGLYTLGTREVHFDDVTVAPIRGIDESFARTEPGKWQAMGGQWAIDEPAGALRLVSEGRGKYITGERDWTDYRTQVRVEDWQSGRVGLVFHYRDEENYSRFTCGRDGTVRADRVVDGKWRLWGKSQTARLSDGEHVLAVEVDRGLMRAYLDGREVLQTWKAESEGGKVGLCGDGAAGAAFGNFSLQFPEQAERGVPVNEVFAREQTMSSWAAGASDWIPLRSKKRTVYWHRSDFPDDVELEAKPPADWKDGLISLMISARSRSPETGYELQASRPEGQIRLRRQAQPVKQAPLPAGPIQTIRLSRRGQFVIAWVNGTAVAHFRDARPLRGTLAAWSGDKGLLTAKRVSVFSDHVYAYTFGRAPSSWRPAGGTWSVMSRWECDRRWKFFGGTARKTVAAIWNKREFDGDLTLEFAAAIRMENFRGRNYRYARDVNTTICGDGKDLTSGYSFVWGGWKNRVTAILKGTVIAKETTQRRDLIPISSNLHRRWFYFKIEKKGNHLFYWVDNRLVLTYHDPKPLTGNRIAIWTYDNGIIVSRVRISCAQASRLESPDFPSRPVSRTCYD